MLSQKKILAFILKRMVEEFKDESVQDIMTKYIEDTPRISQVPVHPDETNQEIERIQGNNIIKPLEGMSNKTYTN